MMLETWELVLYAAIVVLLVIGIYSALLNYWMWKDWNRSKEEQRPVGEAPAIEPEPPAEPTPEPEPAPPPEPETPPAPPDE